MKEKGGGLKNGEKQREKDKIGQIWGEGGKGGPRGRGEKRREEGEYERKEVHTFTVHMNRWCVGRRKKVRKMQNEDRERKKGI